MLRFTEALAKPNIWSEYLIYTRYYFQQEQKYLLQCICN